MKNNTQRLTVSGIMIALGTLLSFLAVYRLPYGGSITVFSMVPIMLIGYIYGARWGILSGAVFGGLQALLGATMSAAFAGQKLWGVLLILFLDYIVAFSVLGLAGIFKKNSKKAASSFALGCLIAGLLRLIAHFVSGVILFGGWAEWYFTQEGFPSFGAKILERTSGLELSAIYSLIYNASYMIPETLLTVFAAVILINVKPIKKIAFENTNKV
jgi:thiamine transporter